MRVLTGLAAWEAPVLLPPEPPGVSVARRCVDVEDLLAAAATGVGDAAVVSGQLPRLDLDAVAQLRALGLVVVGVAVDEAAEQRLRRLGVQQVMAAEAPDLAQQLARTLLAARVEPAPPPLGSAQLPGPRRRSGSTAAAQEAQAAQAALPSGRVVAVWGPTGAPGRTTVALGLAAEVARRGWPVLAVDADPYGGALADWVAPAAEVSGLAVACRRANAGAFQADDLAGLLVTTSTPGLRVLTGLDRADRWPELRPPAVGAVLRECRRQAAVTVVDVGFGLEQDEELVYDTAAPRRNGATVAALEEADVVVVVGTPDRRGLRRLVVGLAELRELLPDALRVVVVNRDRPSVVPGAAQARALLHAEGEPVRAVLPEDPSLDRAQAAGEPPAAAGPLGQALVGLVSSLVRA